ncbi:MAG: hypothetical protein ACE5G2_10925, partial [Candidatus Krumholzibacteriia bacterium]
QDARQRLTALGPKLIDQYLDRSEQFNASGEFVKGAEALQSIDALVDDAGGVGVHLARPEDYGSRRRASFNGAIDWLMSAGGRRRAGAGPTP